MVWVSSVRRRFAQKICKTKREEDVVKKSPIRFLNRFSNTTSCGDRPPPLAQAHKSANFINTTAKIYEYKSKLQVQLQLQPVVLVVVFVAVALVATLST